MKSGTAFVVGLAALGLAGWLLYQPYLPKTWLRDLSGEIAARAAPDPTPPPAEDVRQAQRREPAEHPYICAADIIRVPWDRILIVAAPDDILAHPVLAHAAWESGARAATAARMKGDPRYQLIVLLKDGAVADAELFFTFWGDLSALTRTDGFTRAEAVFTAASEDGVYVVAPAEPVPDGICQGR